MTKKLFKGIKQVSSAQYNAAKEANEASGYLWFVRAEVPEGEGEDNNVANDNYGIYFGTRQYGHFCEGELDAIRTKISDLEGQDTEILAYINSLTALVQENADAIKTNIENIQANTDSIRAINGALTTLLVKNVGPNDKVLNVADGILTSQISLAYDGGFIKLRGKSKEVTTTNEAGEEVTTIEYEDLGYIDAADFIKDSVLEDVKVVTKDEEGNIVTDNEVGEKYIVFTWKTEGSTTKTDEIKVSDFAKVYKAGKALDLTDGVTFNVKVAANDNFLSVNTDNELIVDDMTVDKTKLKEAITIEGGPLATPEVKNAFAGGVIPEGASIQNVLKALLCVEIYPAPSTNTPDYTVEISAPSLGTPTGNSLVKSGNVYLAEIGAEISFGEVTANAVSIDKTNPTVSGFTHGYSSELEGENIVENTSVSSEWTVEPMDNTVYKLSASKSGFTGDLPTTVENASAESCKLAACTLTVVRDTNTYTVTEDAPKHSGTHPGVASYYVVSNLGGRKMDEVSPEIKAQTTAIEKDPLNQSTSFTVTGVYPVFNNMVSTTVSNTVTVDKKMALSTGKAFEISYGPETNAFHAFAYPATHSLSTVEIYNSYKKEYEAYIGGSSTTDTSYKIQGTDTPYKVWKRAGSAYSETTKFRFTLNKNLNK